MTRLPLVFPVHPEAAAAWIKGEVPPGTLFDDPDLLEWVVDRSPVVYLARMNSPREWPMILNAMNAFAPQILISRSRLPGAVRIFLRCGGAITYREPNGDVRLFGDPPATAKFLARLRGLFA